MPLVILLHGAGNSAQGILPVMRDIAARRQFLLLLPQSQGATWDVIKSVFGPDVQVLDRALGAVFMQYRIDPSRIAIAGFSDGATDALSLGLTNGDLVSDVIAFSPGFMAPSAFEGRPRVFISHGKRDNVLPIDRCSRPIVAKLRERHLSVDFREFEGGHVVPSEMAEAALSRFLAGMP